jgi:tetratricopeptide (TPR) repeat protein
MSRRDPRGNPVSTSSATALDASERALWRMLSFYGAPLEDLDAAVAADPHWILPRLMKAGFLLSLTEPALVGEGVATLDDADLLTRDATERERAHLAALRLVAAGDWSGAGSAWQRLLADHPRDALALQWAHLFDFYRGDAAELGARIERVLPAWSDDEPLLPYVLGQHAFGLEELGRYAEAEATGRRALAGATRVPWAIHAVAHVMEMQGRHDDGSAWMAEWRPHWGEGNGFAGHLGWHEALFALERLDHGRGLALFDRYLAAELNEITLQRLDAASLLWRLALQGADVGDRWSRLLAAWPLDEDAAAGLSAFNDVHALLALIGAGELDRAESWRRRSLARAAAGGPWNRVVSRELAAPLMQGLIAFARGRDDEAVDTMLPLRPAARLGGSHAQRDVIDQTLLAAAARGGQRSAGRALLDEKRAARPATPLATWWARALGARGP